MKTPPASIVIAWPRPNYINPVTKGNYLPPVLLTLMSITVIIVILRLYSRWKILKSFGWDDWVIIPATLGAIGTGTANIVSTKYGYGKHLYDVPSSNWEKARLMSYITQITFTITIALTKISILLFYRRFVTKRNNFLKWSIWIVMAFIMSWMIAFVLVVIFQCQPVKAFYTFMKGKCLGHEAVAYQIHGGTNLLSDILVLLMPIPTVLKLQLPPKQKISLLCLFGMGVFVCIAGALRLKSIYHVSTTYDISWFGYDLWMYTTLECLVGILCASAPSLKPLIVKVFPAFGTFHGSRRHGKHSEHSTGNSRSYGSKNGSRKGSVFGSQVPKPTDMEYPLTPIEHTLNHNTSTNVIASTSEEAMTRNSFDGLPLLQVPPKAGIVKTTQIDFQYDDRPMFDPRTTNDSPV